MFHQMDRVLSGFLWFLGQTVTVGGLGAHWFLAFTVILAAAAAWKFPKVDEARARLPYLLILPLYWVFTGFWGAAFPYHWGSGKPQNPEWMAWVVECVVVLFAITWVVLLIKLKGARIVTLLFGVWNSYFLLVMALIVFMSLSGNWI